MSTYTIKEDYRSKLDIYQTQTAIGYIKTWFSDQLQDRLKLKRVSAPLFVDAESGINDNLNGTQEPVQFNIPYLDRDAEIVHSLAKWKRMALFNYDFRVGNGLYTDMNAIRKEEDLDNLHSVYVDQWDWEKVISKNQRTIAYLQSVVIDLVDSIIEVSNKLQEKYTELDLVIDKNIFFVFSEQLIDLYPNMTPKEREYACLKEHPTTFILQIGKKLSDNQKHDDRSPDYDDWELNGDLLFWHETLECPIEMSSMGIRVDSHSLCEQLKQTNTTDRLKYKYHQMILNDELPLTIGGGIGQSRLCMYLLQKAHIGEVQVSMWDEQTITETSNKVKLL